MQQQSALTTPLAERGLQHAAALSSPSSSKAFSTRFLPSDGIPEYNALLDSHLGKRREYLLGNRKSLELLQQTGVITRVQAQQGNPNQYVVYMTEKPIHRRKRLPPKLSSHPGDTSTSSEAERPVSPWNQHGHPRYPPSGLRKSATTPHLTPSRNRSKGSLSFRSGGVGDHDDCDNDDRDEDEDGEDKHEYEHEYEHEHDDVSTSMAFKHCHSGTASGRNSVPRRASNNAVGPNLLSSGGGSSMSSKFAAMKALGRSLSTTALTRQIHTANVREPMAGVSDKTPKLTESRSLRSESLPATLSQFQLRSKSVIAVPPHILPLQPESRDGVNAASYFGLQAQQQTHKKAPLKGTVEHLLESDASYMAQIRAMKDQLTDLDCEKGRLDAEMAQIRKHLRGVNAVHENDVAVAHCSSIMQHRLSKAEEEYMKLLTAQLQVRKDVDRVRREILSLKKVRKKLEADIDDVRGMNSVIEDRIRASKTTRNVVSVELVELEKKAELAAEEQRLNMPPEEAVVVDVEKLMSAVQERNSHRWSSRVPWTPGVVQTSSLAQLISPAGQTSSRELAGVGSTSKPRFAYQAAFEVIQNSLGCKDLASFVASFIEVEEQLLSKYKATLALEEEAVTLQRDVQKLMKETTTRHASIRGSYQASATLHDEMQNKIRTLLSRIDSYNELREVRNLEHTRVRSIMQRCLEVLQAEKLLSGQESIGGPMLMSELPSPALLEALQKKMTEVAMVMKMKHSAKMIEGPKNCFQATGRDLGARRSNMFSTREVSARESQCYPIKKSSMTNNCVLFVSFGQQKIVLGPREPAGSALAAILGSAQAPSVEFALALTEKNSIESNHTAVCAADSGSNSRRSIAKALAVGGVKANKGYDGIDNDAGPSSHHTIESTRRRSSRVIIALPVSKRHHEGQDDADADGSADE